MQLNCIIKSLTRTFIAIHTKSSDQAMLLSPFYLQYFTNTIGVRHMSPYEDPLFAFLIH